jgi:hypothetical protein
MLKIFVVALHYLEYTRERLASTVLLFFWLLTIGAQGIKLHTLISVDAHKQDISGFVLFVAQLSLSVTMFVLENIDRPKSEYMLLDEDEVRNCTRLCKTPVSSINHICDCYRWTAPRLLPTSLAH